MNPTMTELIDGSLVTKDNPMIELYGVIDETIAYLGLARGLGKVYLGSKLKTIQVELIKFPSLMAYNVQQHAKFQDAIKSLVEDTLNFEKNLPSLVDWSIPGESEEEAIINLARVAVRKLERLVVKLKITINIDDAAIEWLNELSNYLFALTRWSIGK